jgi:bifunctional DNA-binding transcriptional regulator/antitoxin component of YhaV-PrlF toxin-antitoxin module
MMAATIVQMRDKGGITLPAELRKRYDLNAGDVFSLIDAGDGAFMLISRVLQVERLGEQFVRGMEEAGVSLDDLLATLDEERETYYKDRYVTA